MASLQREFEEFNHTVSKRTTLLGELQESINEDIRAAWAICRSEEINKLARKFRQVSAAKTDIINACDSVKAYASHLKDFYYIGKEDETRAEIEEELQKGNANPLNDFYSKICEHLIMSQEKYSTFKSNCGVVLKSSETAACKCKEEGNKFKKGKTIGGVTVFVTTGIALYIIAGVPTFGTGAFAGLCIWTGIGALIDAVDCYRAEKQLNKISEIFGSLSDKADSLKSEASKVHRISKKLRDIAHKNFRMELKINIVNTVNVNLKTSPEEVEKKICFSKFYSYLISFYSYLARYITG